MHHIQQRGIVFINDNDCLFARLLVSSLYDTFQSFIRVNLAFSLTIKLFVG